MPDRVLPQHGFWTVPPSVSKFAILKHNLDSTRERFHRDLQLARETGLVVSRFESFALAAAFIWIC
jgi:hypothetical protein